ncbi:MAG: response regulator [Alphaproteobacteria bacterium]|nr:response regulator [Alphaproteobacteria bacterium]
MFFQNRFSAAQRENSREQAGESRAVQVLNSKPARVLLIEDDRTTRHLVTAALQDHCELIDVPDASQGISAYNAFQPDIVFLDIELPDGNGQDLLTWMLRNDPGAFVVMFSGHSHRDNVIKSVETGAKGFVAKPFNPQHMLHFIQLCPKLH